MEWGWTWSGVLSLAATGVLAVVVYFRQNRDHQTWAGPDALWKQGIQSLVTQLSGAVTQVQDGVTELDERIRELSEKLAEADKHDVDADSEPVPGEPTNADAKAPANVECYIEDLKNRGIPLDFSNLRWSKKVRADGDGRGNLGWFVDSDGGKRYFIHRGKKTIIRPAIPRELLAEWERETGRDPREIELDYQTGSGKGNHAWFIRTYAGDRWRVGTGKGSVTVTPFDE